MPCSASPTPPLPFQAPAYVSIRRHTLAYVSIRQRMRCPALPLRQHTPPLLFHAPAYVSIRSSYVIIRQHTSAYTLPCSPSSKPPLLFHAPAYVKIRHHMHILCSSMLTHILCSSTLTNILCSSTHLVHAHTHTPCRSTLASIHTPQACAGAKISADNLLCIHELTHTHTHNTHTHTHRKLALVRPPLR